MQKKAFLPTALIASRILLLGCQCALLAAMLAEGAAA
jgi:hypothetical protein